MHLDKTRRMQERMECMLRQERAGEERELARRESADVRDLRQKLQEESHATRVVQSRLEKAEAKVSQFSEAKDALDRCRAECLGVIPSLRASSNFYDTSVGVLVGAKRAAYWLQKVAEGDEIVSYLCAELQEAIAVTEVKAGAEATHRAEELAVQQAAEKHCRGVVSAGLGVSN